MLGFPMVRAEISAVAGPSRRSREELQRFSKCPVLHQLLVASSRDQSEKRYVQHYFDDHSEDLARWVEKDGGDSARLMMNRRKKTSITLVLALFHFS